MIYIALSLMVGFVVGFKSNINEKMVKVNSRMQTLCLVLLIFVMGIGIGMNKEVLNNLSTLGLKAILFAVISIAGSVFVVYLFSFILEKKED
ncbi:MAG: LysO family transporter [Lachnospiraceae bacterium]|nr:LysO family transporter [Lachnospiraceae bacterium]